MTSSKKYSDCISGPLSLKPAGRCARLLGENLTAKSGPGKWPSPSAPIVAAAAQGRGETPHIGCGVVWRRSRTPPGACRRQRPRSGAAAASVPGGRRLPQLQQEEEEGGEQPVVRLRPSSGCRALLPDCPLAAPFRLLTRLPLLPPKAEWLGGTVAVWTVRGFAGQAEAPQGSGWGGWLRNVASHVGQKRTEGDSRGMLALMKEGERRCANSPPLLVSLAAIPGVCTGALSWPRSRHQRSPTAEVVP
jgi:hypothetical protein